MELVEGDRFHHELNKKIQSLENDGLALTYNHIYYSLVTNFERECHAMLFGVDDCELFVIHMKEVIIKNVNSNRSIYNYLTIEELYTNIFGVDGGVSVVDRRNPEIKKPDRLEKVIEALRKHFDGPDFLPTKQILTAKFNANIEKLIRYFNNDVNELPVEIHNKYLDEVDRRRQLGKESVQSLDGMGRKLRKIELLPVSQLRSRN